MTQPESSPTTVDARDGDGDPRTDPAALGEEQFAEPDGDGGAVAPGADTAPTD